MKLFDKGPVNCDICGQDVNTRDGKLNASNGVVCRACYSQSGITRLFGNLSDVTLEELRDGIAATDPFRSAAQEKSKESEELDKTFVQTRMVGYMSIDDNNQLLRLTQPKSTGGQLLFVPLGSVLHFSDIDGCEVSEDGMPIETIKKSPVGRAIVGGLLFGGAGAVVGAITAKEYTSSSPKISKVTFYIHTRRGDVSCELMSAPAKTTNFTYTHAVEVARDMSFEIREIIDKASLNAARDSENLSNTSEEIRKFKSLLDDGIITQEDFEQKKKQILGL